MRQGRIEQDAPPEVLYERPATAFAASFIGTPPMNLLPLAASPEGAVIAGTTGPIVLPARCAGGMLGVRPEHLALAFERGVRAEVDNVEYLGGDSLVTCRIAATALAVKVGGSVALRRGDPAWLTWPAGAQHYFAPDGVRQPLPSDRPAATEFA